MKHRRQQGAFAPRSRGMGGGRAHHGRQAPRQQSLEAALNAFESSRGGERRVIAAVPLRVPPAELLGLATVTALCATAFTPLQMKLGAGLERCIKRIRRTVQEDYEVLRGDLARAMEPSGS